MNEIDKQRESFIPPDTVRAGIPWFVGFTIANVVSTAASIGDFSYESAPMRAAISTGLLIGIGKIATHRLNFPETRPARAAENKQFYIDSLQIEQSYCKVKL